MSAFRRVCGVLHSQRKCIPNIAFTPKRYFSSPTAQATISDARDNPATQDPRQLAASIRKRTKMSDLDGALDLLNSALSNARSDQYVVEAALNACFLLNQPERITEVLAKLRQFDVELSEAMVSALIVGYCRINQPENAFESFEVAQEMGMAITNKENILVESLTEHGMAPQLHAVLKAMKDTSAKYKHPNDTTWSNIAKAATTRGDLQLPLALFEQYDGNVANLNNNFWRYFIGGYLNRDTNSGIEAWNQCKKYSTPTSLPYSIVVPLFSKAQRHDQVLQLYKEMIEAGQIPEEQVYTAVLQSCVRTNRLDKAKEVLATMKRQGIKPNQNAYMVVLEGLVRSNELPQAFALLEDMKVDGVKPTNTMWSLIIHGLGKATQLDRAVTVMNKIGTESQPLSLVTYKNVLNSLYQARMAEYSTQQLEELRQLGTKYDDFLQNAVSQTINEALDGVGGNFNAILDEMDAAGLQPDEIMFNILLDGCVRKKRMDQARAAIQRMQSQYHIAPSHITWGIFLKGLGISGLVDEAVALFQEKMPPATRSQYDYNTMIHQMVRNNRVDLAIQFFNEMNTSGVEPTEITKDILMNGFGKTKNLEKCFEVFSAFKEKLGTMSPVSYNMLMSCCIMNRRPDRAVQMMEDMQRSGVQPLSFLGWNVASAAISKINKLESSFDIAKKGGIEAYLNVCVECGRKDLLVVASSMMKQANVEWEPVQQQLQKDDPQLLEKVQLWLQQAGEAPLSEDQLKKLDASLMV